MDPQTLHIAPVEIVHNLDAPDYNPPDCPAWAKETLPAHLLPYRGRNGMPLAYRSRPIPLGGKVQRIDRYHANQFLMVRPETRHFLYSSYTPAAVNYPRGLLPAFEAVADPLVAGCATETDKALALLMRGTPRVKHPSMPPCGPPVSPDRGLDDEALLASGVGWCNEQARIFIRLCQVSQIPARIVHLFYSDEKSGHCIAEFHADGRWCMADTSWFCVFPGPGGRLLSAAECHDRGPGQDACGLAYYNRFAELLAMSDAELNLPDAKATEAWRKHYTAQTPQSLAAWMNVTAIINYPLPIEQAPAPATPPVP